MPKSKEPAKGIFNSPNIIKPPFNSYHYTIKRILSKPSTSSFKKSKFFNLSSIQLDQIQSSIITGIKKSTLKTYATGLGAFITFCKEQGVIWNNCLPIDFSTLSLFLSYANGKLSSGYVASWFHGLKFYHLIWGLPFKFKASSPTIKSILNSISNNVPPSSVRPIRQPLTDEMMVFIYSNINQRNNKDIAIWAALVLAFNCMLRSFNFIVSSQSSFDAKLNISTSNLSRSNNGSYSLFLPTDKTYPKGIKIHLPRRKLIQFDPIQALVHHLNWNRNATFSLDYECPLFAFINDGKLVHLTGIMISNRISSILSKKFSDFKFNLHCLRISGLLHWLLAGASFEDVKVQGRWADVGSWRSYLKDHSLVMANHLGLLEKDFMIKNNNDESILVKKLCS